MKRSLHKDDFKAVYEMPSLSPNVSGLSQLYADVYSLFTFEPGLKAKVRGVHLLDGFRKALDKFCKQNESLTVCDEVIISWMDTYVGQQGRLLFQTDHCEVSDESFTHASSEMISPLSARVESYINNLDLHRLPSLTDLHVWAPSASFWVLGNPRDPLDKTHVTLTSLFLEFSSRQYAITRYPSLVEEMAHWASLQQTPNTAPDIVLQFLDILTERYCHTRNKNYNIYHVPKYGVDFSYDKNKDLSASLDFEVIFTFQNCKPHACIHYLPRAIHLFLDLLSSYLFHHELRSSMSRLRLMEVEERSILHNLSYIFDPKSPIDRYVRSRLQFVSRKGGIGKYPMRPVLLDTIFSRLSSDQQIHTELFKANIPGRVCVDLPFGDSYGVVLLPGGLEGTNIFRVIIENLIRNAAKHSSEQTVRSLSLSTSHIEISSRADLHSPEYLIVDLAVPLYDDHSIDAIRSAYFGGTYLLSDSLEPSVANMGCLEILLCCLSLLGLSPQLLIGQNCVFCESLSSEGHFLVYISGIPLLEIRQSGKADSFGVPLGRTVVGESGATIITYSFKVLRARTAAIISSQAETFDGYSVIDSRKADASDVGQFYFLLSSDAESSLMTLACDSVPIPRSIVICLEECADVAVAVSRLFGSEINAYGKLWMKWRHVLWKHPVTILVIGARFSSSGSSSLIYRLESLDVTIHFISFPFSRTVEGESKINEITSNSFCKACFLHGAAVPSDAIQSIGRDDGLAYDEDSFLYFKNVDYAVLGWKEGREFPSLVDDLLRDDGGMLWRDSTLASLVQHMESWKYRILVIDERSRRTFSSRMAGDHTDGEGLPGSISFQESWSLVGVDIVFNVTIKGLFDKVSKRDYDYYLIHDAFYRDEKNADEIAILRDILRGDLARKVIIHSDGSTFAGAKAENLFTQSWTGLAAALGWGSKLQLILQISSAVRYNQRGRIPV